MTVLQNGADGAGDSDSWTESSIAAELASAEADRREIDRFTLTRTDLGAVEAYRIQSLGIGQRAARGYRRVGVKLGLTSEAKQQQMGVLAPITGILTEDMLLPPGKHLDMSTLIHPKVEPEIVFVMGEDLSGPDVTVERARHAVSRVLAGIEIIDSRYRNFQFRFEDVIADNGSSAKFILGEIELDPAEIDLITEPAVLRRQNEQIAEGTGSAVLGDPYWALAVAANEMATRGDFFRAGEWVLTGALTDAHPIAAGQLVTAEFGHLGTISLRAQ